MDGANAAACCNEKKTVIGAKNFILIRKVQSQVNIYMYDLILEGQSTRDEKILKVVLVVHFFTSLLLQKRFVWWVVDIKTSKTPTVNYRLTYKMGLNPKPTKKNTSSKRL